MPLYDYYCDCGTKKEDVMQSISEVNNGEVPKCDSCGADMKRKCGNAGFKLKGGGWAKDGYSQYIGDINKFRAANGGKEVDYNEIHDTDF